MPSSTMSQWIAIGVSTAALVIALLPRGPQMTEPPAAHNTPSPSASRRSESASIQALRSEIADLGDRQDELDEQIGDLLEPAPEPPRSPEDAMAEVLGTLEQAERTELRDARWAGAAEADIVRRVGGAVLPGAEVADVQCHSSFCRVDLVLDMTRFEDPVGVPLDQVAPWTGQTLFQYDMETGEGFVYVAREGHTLPGRG